MATNGKDQLRREMSNFILGTWVRQPCAPDGGGNSADGIDENATFTITLWDDFSCNSEEVTASGTAHQSGEYTVDVSAVQLTILLVEGTLLSTDTGNGDEPLFAAAPAKTCRLDLEDFVRSFRRADGGTHWELALSRSVAAAVEVRSGRPSRSQSFDRLVPPASAEAAPEQASTGAEAEEALWRLARSLGQPTTEVRLARQRVLELQIASHQVRTVAAALQQMAELGSFLSEFGFFVRFYVNESLTIASDLFAFSPEDLELWGPDMDPEMAWRLTMRSKLSEYTGCGHFASVLRDNVYFGSRQLAAQASLASAAMKPAQLGDVLRSRPDSSFLIRVEWSAYEARARERAIRLGKRPEAMDFHAYLIDIPAETRSGTARRSDGWRDGYLVQSLWYHYDASVQAVDADDLRRHCHRLAAFDGRTPRSAALHNHFTGRYFYGAPLTAVRPDAAVPQRAQMTEEEERRLERRQEGAQLVSVLDVFEVYQYSQADALQRVATICQHAFEPDALVQKVPYGRAGRNQSWTQILDIVYNVNVASQQNCDDRGLRRMVSIGAFL